MWSSEIGKIVEEEFEHEALEKAKNEVNNSFGNAGGLQKNVLFISGKLNTLWGRGHRSESLVHLCEAILEFAGAGKDSSTQTGTTKKRMP
jgi:hypothetical protein